MTVPIGQTVEIGHGRGRLAPEPAASVWRIDAQLGRPADINSAWRDPVTQQKAYDAWVAYSRYLAGGPWAPKAPRALRPSESVHCDGEAADSDDWYNARAAAVWRDNGWRQTARTNNPTTDEPWHGEYQARNDNHRNSTAGSGARPLTPTAPKGWREMRLIKINTPDKGTRYALVGNRFFQEINAQQAKELTSTWGEPVNLSYDEWDQNWNMARL